VLDAEHLREARLDHLPISPDWIRSPALANRDGRGQSRNGLPQRGSPAEIRYDR
jgi:hypothetical protein